jgi:alpha-galactosidase
MIARLNSYRPSVAGCDVVRAWSGRRCRSRITNVTDRPIRLREVVLFDVAHGCPPDTPVYAEGFQMLAQTVGTLAAPEDLGPYPDRTHYRIPEPPGFRAAAGLIALAPPGADRILMGFTSCRKFSGRFHFNAERLQVAVDTEDLELPPGASWDLEELLVATGPDLDPLLDALATAIEEHHPRLRHDPPPTGWCSWYCFGPEVTAADITANLDVIARQVPELRYIQIDDGYQTRMGDWLESGPAFGGGVQQVLREIRQRGFEPALWVAPFVAEAQSQIFQKHPDWFIRDAAGRPLDSSTVGFGGWRRGPWYCLDGTHPAVQEHFESLFRRLRQEWGCTYFKLDANYWGAIHGGRHADPTATRVEAYRRGMEAIVRGAGDAYILGCNAPLWPSLGLVHGQRTSGDIQRTWASIACTGRENLRRAWQNGRLWWNDPDCALLTGNLPENEVIFHATVVLATGGMLFSGDDLTRITPERLATLRRLLAPSGGRMRFADDTFGMGTDGRRIAILNWTDQPIDRTIPLPGRVRLVDLWTGVDIGEHDAAFRLKDIPGRSARLLEMR